MDSNQQPSGYLSLLVNRSVRVWREGAQGLLGCDYFGWIVDVDEDLLCTVEVPGLETRLSDTTVWHRELEDLEPAV